MKHLHVVYLALILVQVIFGINFVASKIIVGQVSPVLWAIIRFFVAGIILFAFALYKYPRDLNWSKAYWIKIFWFAFLGFSVGQLALLKGLQLTTATNSSILCSTIPLFTLIMVLVLREESLNRYKLMGFVLAFVGVLVIRKIEDFSFTNKTFVGDLLILLCAFSTALFISLSKNFLRQHNYWWVTTWMFLVSGLQLSLFLLFDRDLSFNVQWEPILMGAMVFVILGATLLTYFLSNWALVHISSGRMSMFIYLQPVVASVVAWAYLGEHLKLRTFLSCGLILAGMILTLNNRSLQKRDKRDADR